MTSYHIYNNANVSVNLANSYTYSLVDQISLFLPFHSSVTFNQLSAWISYRQYYADTYTYTKPQLAIYLWEVL